MKYLELEEMWETTDKIVYCRNAGFHEVEYFSDTEKELGDDIVETIIYKEGTESEAYRKQMRANSAHVYFIYKDKIKTVVLDMDFSVELKSKEECMKYIEKMEEDIHAVNTANERIIKLRKAQKAVDYREYIIQ
ncbi:uncharacterized protein KQ657_002067 [Scheffersomyces spartinae]|uniref:Uncharacterized protein n=1 Tax=Scheffersomyces spartinae TaxID=45513 RepID=A0A9P7VE98_9ASCO|nr:uncharacterized protein KQ657_002067 [Scheffersomyces spartinae]KAG7195686.1 hypothetical protein KQ657_002067 [Scheffersomyces spartinae]